MSLPWTGPTASHTADHSVSRPARWAACRQRSVPRPAPRSVHRSTLSAHVVPTPTARFGEDDLLLLLLVSTWELLTARPAPAVPLVEMTEQELLEYWSDPADEPAPLPYRPTGHPGPFPAAAAVHPTPQNAADTARTSA